MTWLVAYLGRIGATTIASPIPPQSLVDDLVERYRRYLLTERGLAEETVVEYVRVTVPFVREHAGRGFGNLVAGDVSGFVTRECQAVSTRTAERLATGLRSFLGFALLEGMIATPLASAVPSVALMERSLAASGPRTWAAGRTPGELRSEPSDWIA